MLYITKTFDGLVQERRNSIANALELRLSYTNPSIWCIVDFAKLWVNCVVPRVCLSGTSQTCGGTEVKEAYYTRGKSQIAASKGQWMETMRPILPLCLTAIRMWISTIEFNHSPMFLHHRRMCNLTNISEITYLTSGFYVCIDLPSFACSCISYVNGRRGADKSPKYLDWIDSNGSPNNYGVT